MIEVEIRVTVTAKQLNELIDGAQFVSKQVLKNEIYDSIDFKLTTKNFWLRCRDGVFELKYPVKKDDNLLEDKDIAVHEINDEQEIRRILCLSTIGSMSEALAAAGFTVLYRFTNTRNTYTKDGFTIIFDHADFGDLTYDVCEIESIITSVDQTNRAFESLWDFAKRHGISTERAEGKLEYYMRVKNPAHYFAIVNSSKTYV